MAKRDIDAYISAQSEPEKKLLKDMRNIILEIEPNLKQVISYGIPAFKLDGEGLWDCSAYYGRRMINHLIQGDRKRSFVSCHYI